MNKPNYRQLRAEIQNLSRSRARGAKAAERRSDSWRDLDDEEAAEDGFALEDDDMDFSIGDEDDDSFADPRRLSRRVAANERHARALQKIAHLLDESRYGVSRSRGLDEALEALTRSINANERRTARALETIVAELIEEDRVPPAADRRPRQSRRAPPIEGPARSLVPEHDQAVAEPADAPEALAERLEGAAARFGAPEGRRAESEPTVVKLPLADAILDITRRQHSLRADADLDACDPGSVEPGVPGPAEGDARRPSGETEALERQIGSLRGDLDDSAERERHILLQVDGLREEIRSLTRGVAELAPRASVEAIERALADLAERVDAQRGRGVEDQALAPAERIAGELRAVLQEIDPRPHMRELEADIGRLADRLDQVEAVGEAGEACLQELARRTAEIQESLSALAARPLPLEQIEARLRELTIRVEKLNSGTEERSQDLIDAAKAIRAILSTETGSDAFNQRLDRLSAKLEEALDRFDGARFEELGARIDEMHQSLAQRIDQGMSQASPHVVALEGRLADLAEKVDHALSRGAAPVAVASLEGKVDRLDEKLDRLEPRALAAQLEELLARAKPSEECRLAEITERLDVMQRTLATQIDESARWRKDDTHKAQLSALLEQLANRSAEACGPGADPAAVNALSEQVRQLSARLDRSLNDGATLASIESKIAELCEKIEDSRAGAARAAKSAARGAAPDPRQPAPPAPLERQLDALDDLFEAQESDGARAQDATTTARNAAGPAVGGGADNDASAGDAGNQAPKALRFAPQWGRRRHDEAGSESGAPSSARAVGVDLELKQQADFIAAARRAAERAGADAAATRDRKISITELEASRGSHAGAGAQRQASAAPNRKSFILAGLTGVALIAAAAPIGRAVFDPPRAGSAVEARAAGDRAPSRSSQKFALNIPASLGQKFSLSEHGAAATKPSSKSAGVETTNGPSDGSAAKAERKSVAAERIDPTPVGAIEKPVALPQEAAPLQALAQRGDARAQFELGVRYAEGRGGAPRDSNLAAEWFSKAADQGVAIAQYRLGSLYEKGVGVERSFERARSLYEKAANAGNARAMHNLGVLFVENGDGWPDYASAAGWFRKAAEYGVRDSQFNLAVLYARGMGVEQNLVQSYLWFSVAAAQGDPEAARKRDEVAARLETRDLATAKSLAEAFKPKEPARDVNEAEPPRSPGPSLTPPAKQPDGPTASATVTPPKLSGL